MTVSLEIVIFLKWKDRLFHSPILLIKLLFSITFTYILFKQSLREDCTKYYLSKCGHEQHRDSHKSSNNGFGTKAAED